MNLSASLFLGGQHIIWKSSWFFCSYFLEKSYSSSSSSRWKILYKDWCRKNCITKMFFFSLCKNFKSQSLYLVSSKGGGRRYFFPSKNFLLQPEDFFFWFVFCFNLVAFFFYQKMKAQIKKNGFEPKPFWQNQGLNHRERRN